MPQAGVSPREHRRGILMMMGATLCWSIAGLLTRHSHIANGWEITFWRSFYTAIFMAVVLFAWHGRGAIGRITAMGIPGVISGMLFAVMFTCFMLALTRTSTANALVLTCTSPFYAAVLGWIFLRERISLRTWIAMPCTFAGIVLMFAQSLDAGGVSGNLIALLVPLAYGFNIVVMRKTGRSIDMMPTVLLGGIFSVIVTIPFALPFTALPSDHLLMLVMGVVQLGIGTVLLTRAVRYLRASEVGLLSLLETILGPLWTWIGVGETPALMTLIGGGIVIGALVANEAAGLWLERNGADGELLPGNIPGQTTGFPPARE